MFKQQFNFSGKAPYELPTCTSTRINLAVNVCSSPQGTELIEDDDDFIDF